MGWFTLAPPSGPVPEHLPIHQQLLTSYNESALLLLFHPTSVASEGTSRSGKLPLTIYESILETSTMVADDGDKTMVNGGEGAPQHSLRFQELPYTIETGEAEMISVDAVARGGANAARLDDSTSKAAAEAPASSDAKGKAKATSSLSSNKGRSADQTNGTADTNGPSAEEKEADLILSSEDSDHIASLTAKANAIRMLQQRIGLIKSYLHRLPTCYLTDPPPQQQESGDGIKTQKVPADLGLDHQVLRQTSALLARLPLLTAAASPPPPETNSSTKPSSSSTSNYTTQTQRLQSSVALTSLLGTMGSTLSTAKAMGRKAQVFEGGKANKESKSGMGGNSDGNGAFAGQIPGFAEGFAGAGGGFDGRSGEGMEEDGMEYEAEE